MAVTRKIVAQAGVVARQVRRGIKRAATMQGQLVVEALARHLEEVRGLTRRVLDQTRARVIKGNTHFKNKVFSIFETATEAIRKGKAAKPTEFGKMVKIQEAENEIVSDYDVFAERPADQKVLLPAIETHKEIFERAPEVVSGDAAFFSAENEAKAKEPGVKKIAIPNKQTRSPARWEFQKQRWFRRAQRWRVGAEGRISSTSAGMACSAARYKGGHGMERWVGFGVIANNLINIARATTK